MRTDTRTELMETYFTVHKTKFSFSNIVRISFGLALFGVFIMFSFNNTILAGTILILTGLTLFGIWIKPYFENKRLYETRPTEEQMNNWLIEDLHRHIKEIAIKKLDLNISTLELKNFIIVPYPVYWEEPGLDETSIYKVITDNGNISYSVWNVQVIALTKNYISYYTCTYDWLNNFVFNEHTNEFFYDDISSVKNDMRMIERYLKDNEYLNDDGKIGQPHRLTASVFEVTNISSDSLKVITDIDDMGHSPDLVVNLEKAVQALRIIIRKRRYNEEQKPTIIEKKEETGETDK